MLTRELVLNYIKLRIKRLTIRMENKLTEQNRVIDDLNWSDSTKVPFQVYTDESIYI